MKPNPCLGCGACCAFFRVQFYWSEEVPSALSVDLDSRHRCMRGTEKKHRPKCIALVGRIGQNAKCGFYENRPTPCRRFEASYENGVRNPRCDEARLAHGLAPLRRQDWPKSDTLPPLDSHESERNPD